MKLGLGLEIGRIGGLWRREITEIVGVVVHCNTSDPAATGACDAKKPASIISLGGAVLAVLAVRRLAQVVRSVLGLASVSMVKLVGRPAAMREGENDPMDPEHASPPISGKVYDKIAPIVWRSSSLLRISLVPDIPGPCRREMLSRSYAPGQHASLGIQIKTLAQKLDGDFVSRFRRHGGQRLTYGPRGT